MNRAGERKQAGECESTSPMNDGKEDCGVKRKKNRSRLDELARKRMLLFFYDSCEAGTLTE
ncbi:MAG: hypothetical protein E7294_03395 [Lachnospiraceae bacterium]|nr:hypothetical protein [Lachnospiraceae bacterium]